MAPQTRSSRGLSRQQYQEHQKLLRAGPVNTHGFPAFPVELLLEIVSYFCTPPLPDMQHRLLGERYLERSILLRALSQCCRSLRGIFLPFLWQRMEVRASRSAEKIPRRHWRRPVLPPLCQKDLATELVRQCEILTIRDPTLAIYVKVVNIMVTEFSTDTVLVELARCLALFPNLHTIQMLVTPGVKKKDVDDAFRGHRYPSVRTVIVPALAHSVLDCCPDLRSVTFNQEAPADFIDFFAKHSPKLETLCGLARLDYQKDLQKLVKVLPSLRALSLDANSSSISPGSIWELSKLKQLVRIELTIKASKNGWVDPATRQLISTAEDVLRKAHHQDQHYSKKAVVLRFSDGCKMIEIGTE